MSISPQLQDLINRESQREIYVRELEAKVSNLTTALTGNQPVHEDDMFSMLTPENVALYITIAQIRDGYQRGLLLNVTEAALATGKAVSQISAEYRNPGSNLPSLQLLNRKIVSASNRTTLFYIGWLATKHPGGPGTRAWRESREAYNRWVEANLDRPE